MSSARFEPTIPADELPQNHALDSAATGIAMGNTRNIKCSWKT